MRSLRWKPECLVGFEIRVNGRKAARALGEAIRVELAP
jgi:hypothetical protein